MHDRLPRCWAEWWSDGDLDRALARTVQPPDCGPCPVRRHSVWPCGHTRRQLQLQPGGRRRSSEVDASVELLPSLSVQTGADVFVARARHVDVESREEP